MTPPPEVHAGSPPLTLLGAEPLRALFEYASMRFTTRGDPPAGDGHPVVVFPGLASDKLATRPLMSYCRELGYDVHDWGRGFNTGPEGDPQAWLDDLARHVARLPAGNDGRISLVGWSLGGIYAREIAKRLKRRVRQVITIGSPFAGGPDQTHAGLVYQLLNRNKAALPDRRLLAELASPPPVPTTSIYSRSDGIVAWQACIQAGSSRQTENVEVEGSHCGLGWNARVLEILADRLSQPPGAWKPYDPARSTPHGGARARS